MARHNHITGCGYLEKAPLIAEENGKEVAIFEIVTLRYKQEKEKEASKEDLYKYDYMTIKTKDKTLVNKIRELSEGDFVLIKGTVSTGHLTMTKKCEKCGNSITYTTPFVYVSPLIIHRMYENLTIAEAKRQLSMLYEISNFTYLLGNVVEEKPQISMLKESKIKVAQFAIGIPRKVMVKGEDISTKADYPYVKAFGRVAADAEKCVKQGTLCLIDGTLMRKCYDKELKCDSCNSNTTAKAFSTTIIANNIEFLKGSITDEEKELTELKKIQEEKKKIIEEHYKEPEEEIEEEELY